MLEGSLHVCVEDAVPPVVRASGELDQENCERFESILQETLGSNHDSIVLALGSLTFVDSSGLRVLIKAAMDAHSSGCDLRISSMSPHLDRVLTISGFKHLFQTSEVTERTTDGAAPAEVHEYCFEAPRVKGACGHVRSKVGEFARKMGFDPLALDDIRLAIGEAISNAVRHGAVCSDNVSVRCRNHSGNLIVTLKYPSAEFDPNSIPVPTYDSATEGGMGIYFMKLVMDKVQYEFKDGYMVLTLEKRLPADPSRPLN